MACRAVASLNSRPFSSRRAAPLLWLRSPKLCSRVRLRLSPLSLTQQRRLKRCRLRWRTSAVVGTRRSHFVAPPFRFLSCRLGSSRKRPCIERRPTIVGADGPEAAYHFLAPRRPAAQLDVMRHGTLNGIRHAMVTIGHNRPQTQQSGYASFKLRSRHPLFRVIDNSWPRWLIRRLFVLEHPLQ